MSVYCGYCKSIVPSAGGHQCMGTFQGQQGQYFGNYPTTGSMHQVIQEILERLQRLEESLIQSAQGEKPPGETI